MLKLKPKPELWSHELVFLPCRIAGSFAKWAQQQSPYTVPECLGEAIIAVDAWSLHLAGEDGLVRMNSNELRKRLENAFESTPVIESWNHPKSGNEREFYGGDRTGSWQAPDDDIIDLGALARNVTHDLVLECAVDDAQDEYSKLAESA